MEDTTKQQTPRVLGVLLILIFTADLVLGLWLAKEEWFPFSLTTAAYLGRVLDHFSTLTGYVFWALFVAFGFLGPLLMGHGHRTVETAAFTELVLRKLAVALQKSRVSGPIALFLILLLPVIGFRLLRVSRAPAPPRSGKYVIPSDPRAHVYFRVLENFVLMYDLKDLGGGSVPMQALHLGDAGKLSQIAVSNKPKMLYAADPESGLVHVIEWESVLKEVGHIYAGKTAGALALSADGRKLYVAITGPIPLGKIMVFDTSNRAELASIEGLGCPVDVFASSAAPRLFIATQCGAGYDPVYVVDTRDDRIIAKVADFAVGSSIAAAPDGKIAAAVTTRGSSISVTKEGKILLIALQDRLSLIKNYSDRSPVVKTYQKQVTAMAVSPEGAFLLVGTPTRKEVDGYDGGAILVLSLDGTGFCKGVPLNAAPEAIAIGPDLGYRAFFPDGNSANVGDIRALACN
jgi:hypothetical protein